MVDNCRNVKEEATCTIIFGSWASIQSTTTNPLEWLLKGFLEAIYIIQTILAYDAN